jgi:hydrogenase maturation protein HypF
MNTRQPIANDGTSRLALTIRGAVQGVGFRPFVFRLATSLALPGWVVNSAQGVFIEVEGQRPDLDAFLLRLQSERPQRASIQSLEFSWHDPVGYERFEIRHSENSGPKTALVLPDIAVCSDCLAEVFNPTDRRFLYPFTNCTNCGPRFTIIEALPYDRPNTSMKSFAMCGDCKREYENPADRRFHAQPNACPSCGPQLALWDEQGSVVADRHEAMLQAAEAIREGMIVAVKGLGGFHLVVDAGNEFAVERLRQRKRREEKPFALMVPSLEQVKEYCEVSEFEERVLLSPESPIVLLERTPASPKPPTTERPLDSAYPTIADSVAPHNPYLGIMLPYTPLHHLLMRELGFPVVATSGNRSDEPICTDEHEALERLNGIADALLVHNRPIVRHVDDSIVRMMMGRELVLRRARGYAPLPIAVRGRGESALLAVGAHLKNTVALSIGNNVFISQHIGDLGTKQSFDAFHQVVRDLPALYEAAPQRVVCDMHPDYISTHHARTVDEKAVAVQHHYAHVASCMAENELEGEVLGVSWDGTGYGPDGTVWGGEFLITTEDSYRRVATLRSFMLPGGERAIIEPRRTALGALYELIGPEVFAQNDLTALWGFSANEQALLRNMLAHRFQSPRTTSAGRLFDAVASLLGFRQRVYFEGQAAMELEFLTANSSTSSHYGVSFRSASDRREEAMHELEPGPENARPSLILDWEGCLKGILHDRRAGVETSLVATKFHNTLVEMIVAVAQRVGVERVVLSGGCFQNKYLTEKTVRRLSEEGFRPYWHQRVPPNDGGIALGQVYAHSRFLKSTVRPDIVLEESEA